ncbi:MAG: hypothetical protein ACI9DH_001667, partial [Halioglobus sp.]
EQGIALLSFAKNDTFRFMNLALAVPEKALDSGNSVDYLGFDHPVCSRFVVCSFLMILPQERRK